VKDVPENFKQWVEKNRDRIKKANNRGTLPYFLKDNANFAGISVNPKNLMEKVELQRIANNKTEYVRLKSDSNYTDVRFNDNTGGLLAIHKDHNLDPTIGKFGIPRGDYEQLASEVLYKYGKSVVLESENLPDGIKTPEGLLDGAIFDIKGIEGTGKNNILNKIKEASSQGVSVVVLYYPDKNIFFKDRLIDSYNTYLKTSKSKRVKIVYYIVDGKLHKI
jgi:hypothetical protein